jgi:hypothetical protein
MRKNSTVVGRFAGGALAMLVGVALFAGTAAAQVQGTLTVSVSEAKITETPGASAKSTVTVSLLPPAGMKHAGGSETVVTVDWGGDATRDENPDTVSATDTTTDYHVVLPPNQTHLSIDGTVINFTFSVPATPPMKLNEALKATLTVTSKDDDTAEGDETVAISVSTLKVGVSTGVGIITITDNDNPGVSTLALEVDKALLKESGTTEAARTAEVKIKASRGQTFTTPQTIVLELGGDATKDVDYTIKKETLILDAGETEVDTDLIVLNDMVYDGPVMETVRISAFVGTVQLGETKTIHLEDNDQNPENFTLSVSPASVAEGETATVTVTAKAALAADQKFMLTVTGTATANEDFTLAPDLTVAKAATKGSTLLQAVKDSVSGEADETVMITATAGGIMVGTATVTIKGDTATPTTPTPTSDLGAPTIEDVKAGAKMLTVMWSAVEGATGYMVQWKTKSQSYGATRQASTTQMTHSIMELTNGMEYMVRVRGMKGDAYGKWSEEAMGTPTGETAVPTPALPVFGAFALAAGLVTAGRRRLRTRQRALLTD